MFPRIARWPDVYHEGRYDAFALVAGIEENEVRRNNPSSWVISYVIQCLLLLLNHKCTA